MFNETRKFIVDLVVNPFSAAFPGVPLITDNEPFDWSALPETLVELEVEFQDGRQIGMAQRPRTRLSGYVYITTQVREGTGAATAQAIQQWFSDNLAYRQGQGVTLGPPVPGGSSHQKGRRYYDLKINFYADPR